MMGVEGALVDQMLLDEGKVVQRLKVKILVVGQNEDDVWFAGGVLGWWE